MKTNIGSWETCMSWKRENGGKVSKAKGLEKWTGKRRRTKFIVWIDEDCMKKP